MKVKVGPVPWDAPIAHVLIERGIDIAMWEINEQHPNIDRLCVALGDALLSIQDENTKLDSDMDKSMYRRSYNISVQLHKILSDGSPLIRAVKNPQLPKLSPTGSLVGDVYENIFRLSPSPRPKGQGQKHGTGLDIYVVTQIHPLWGFRYHSQSKTYFIPSPWDEQYIPVNKWLKQSLVTVNYNVYTIKDVIQHLRHWRGAHYDAKKLADVIPQPLRATYAQYSSVFVMHVGNMVLKEARRAIDADPVFRQKLFPEYEGQNPLVQRLSKGPRRFKLKPRDADPLNLNFKEGIKLQSGSLPPSGGIAVSCVLHAMGVPGGSIHVQIETPAYTNPYRDIAGTDYHILADCPLGQAIPKDRVEMGANELPLCEHCWDTIFPES